MYIPEVIEKLKEVMNEHGEDVMVVFAYRDSGGDYYDYDSDLRFEYGEVGSEADDYRDEVKVFNKEKGYWHTTKVPKIIIL